MTSQPQASGRSEERLESGLGFGTAPVFLASISTILGAILFLRFGYTVGHAGLLGTLLIILLGHLVTLPTALAIAEIATNRRVEGGGVYFIVARSFGTTIGAAIGIALYFSQAISVAFYMIAFAEAFGPLAPWFTQLTGMPFDPRWVSLPGTLLLVGLIAFRGANLGVQALWVVVAILGISLLLFFLGAPLAGSEPVRLGLLDKVANHDPFFLVFAIAFPAFTGMTAGVGLSGDLANPRRAIPLGTIAATVAGMLIYVAVALKLSASASPEMLAQDQLIMAKIAVWPPIIPIGLACATLSSAIGSILIAPRTLQALAADRVVPLPSVVRFLGSGVGPAHEPRHATLVSGALALITVAMGSVDFVARIISMFFMVAYGALCAISFLEHFAARPSYRPSFRSKWYLSLLGAVVCLLLMFQMEPVYALLSLIAMGAIYFAVSASRRNVPDGFAAMFQGVMTQATRRMQIQLQKNAPEQGSEHWRPSIIMVNGRTFERFAQLQLLTWLCHRHAVGTYLHFIQGQLDNRHYQESRKVVPRLIQLVQSMQSNLFVDTMISPSMRSALAQTLQVPGISGVDNNTVLFEFAQHDPPEVLEEVYRGCQLAWVPRMDMLVLRHGNHFFGARKDIHVWLTWHDYQNANLMILLPYILMGHPDWEQAEIQIFAAFPKENAPTETERLNQMVAQGRIPVSPRNVTVIPTDDQMDYERLVEERSSDADLVLHGFTMSRLEQRGAELLKRHPKLRDVLFVAAAQQLEIR